MIEQLALEFVPDEELDNDIPENELEAEPDHVDIDWEKDWDNEI